MIENIIDFDTTKQGYNFEDNPLDEIQKILSFYQYSIIGETNFNKIEHDILLALNHYIREGIIENNNYKVSIDTLWNKNNYKECDFSQGEYNKINELKSSIDVTITPNLVLLWKKEDK